MSKHASGWLALALGAMFLTPAVIAHGQSRKAPIIKTPTKKGRVKVPRMRFRIATKTPASGDTVVFNGGTYKMGEDNASASARPAHSISVKPFRIQKREVSVSDYRQCVQAGKCTIPRTAPGCNWGQSTRDAHPVNCVDWYQAKAYCEFRGMRLPTEAEWEFAARSKGTTVYPWGNEDPGNADLCWRKNSSCQVQTHAKDRTAQGIFDMAGNVKEWTSSPFCSYSSGGCATTERSVRGGTWNASTPAKVHPSERNGYHKSVRSSLIGFRCASDIPTR